MKKYDVTSLPPCYQEWYRFRMILRLRATLQVLVGERTQGGIHCTAHHSASSGASAHPGTSSAAFMPAIGRDVTRKLRSELSRKEDAHVRPRR